MGKCTVNVDAIEINTQAGVTVVNGYVTEYRFDEWGGHTEGWLGEEKAPTTFVKRSAEQAASSKAGPVRYIVTRGVADCVVVANVADHDFESGQGVTRVVNLAHLSSKQYAPKGASGYMARCTVRSMLTEFQEQYAGASCFAVTNTRYLTTWDHMKKMGLGLVSLFTIGGNLSSVDIVLDIETGQMFPIADDGGSYKWWTNDVTTYQDFARDTGKQKKHKKHHGCIIF